jgi:predicted DNA binding CopG/RHH family protein
VGRGAEMHFGQNDVARLMFVVFTIRGRLIRVVSARDMSRRERRIFRSSWKKTLPKFKNEDAEREFWADHDSTEFINWRRRRRMTLPNLKPSSQTISLRLPKPMLDRLKLLANKRDVPYQSLLKMFVAERLTAEFEKMDSKESRLWRR